MLLFTLVLVTPALAQQPQDVERVRAGQDIEVWRAMDREDPEELAEFVQEFPSSNLSVLAAQKLDEAGDVVVDLPKSDVHDLELQLADHSANLASTTKTAAIATLDVGSQGTLDAPESRSVRPQVELGATGSLGSAGGYVHAGVTGDHLGAALRATAGQSGADAGFVLRASMSPDQLSPYGELIGTARTPALGGAVGVRQPLQDGFALSLAVESMLIGTAPQPTIRFGAAKVF